MSRTCDNGVKTLPYRLLLGGIVLSAIAIHQLHLTVVLARETLPDGFIPFVEVRDLDLVRYAFFLEKTVHQDLGSSLIKLADKFVADQHPRVTMNHIDAGRENKHRSERDR